MVDGQWAIVSEYIKGKTLAQLMQENKADLEKYLTMFVDLQLEMHSRTCPGLSRLKDKLDHKLSQAKLDAATRCDLHTRLESLPEHSKVCHGDFNPSNILIAENGTPYILDWAHAAQGSASADAARTYLHFWLNGESEHAERYLDLFCQKSDTAKQYVQKWIPIVAASQLTKDNELEKEFLMKWSDVVDFE